MVTEMNTNPLYLIDTRTRFCELGVWCPTQTVSGDLILRRAISLGSLWDLCNGEKFLVEEGLLGVLGEGYEAMSSAGFVGIKGTPWRSKNMETRGIVLGEIIPSNFPDITIQDVETGEKFSRFADGLYRVQFGDEKGVWLCRGGEFFATDIEEEGDHELF